MSIEVYKKWNLILYENSSIEIFTNKSVFMEIWSNFQNPISQERRCSIDPFGISSFYIFFFWLKIKEKHSIWNKQFFYFRILSEERPSNQVSNFVIVRLYGRYYKRNMIYLWLYCFGKLRRKIYKWNWKVKQIIKFKLDRFSLPETWISWTNRKLLFSKSNHN